MKKRFQSVLSLVLVLSLVFGGALAVCATAADSDLVETVLYESDRASSKTVNEDKTDAYFKQVKEIRADINENGAIKPSNGEYYEITVTASVDKGEAELYLAENNTWEEYHGKASGVFTTTESTVTAKISVDIWAIDGEIYVADHGDYGHTINYSYIKVSVFRKPGGSTEPTDGPDDPGQDPSVDYDLVPDQITLTFYGAACLDHAVTWHTYKESADPVVQYVPCPADATPDFSAATTVKAATTNYLSRSMPYDPVKNTFTFDKLQEDLTDYSHQAVMSGLAVDTAYAYRVGDQSTGIWSDVGRFTTRKQAVDAFSFVYTSDTQVAASRETAQYSYLKNTLTGAFQDDPDAAFIVDGGDIVQYGQYLHQWRNVLNGNKQFLMNHVMMPVTGNHDAAYSEFLSYEITKHFCVDYPAENDVLNYGFFYSYDYGDAHFVVLNTDSFKSSDGLIDEKQLDWLKKDLASTKKTWKIVQLHRPLISVRAATQSPSFNQLIGVFNEAKVDLVMQAHEHVFLRSHPIDGQGTILKESETVTNNGVSYYKNPQGVLFMTSSTGGADGKKPSSNEVDSEYCYAYGEGRASSWANITIEGNRLTVRQNFYAAGKVNTYADGEWGIVKDVTKKLYYGDANDDGTVNMKDVLTMRKVVANIDVDFVFEAADINMDAVVNMKDVLAVRKYIADLFTLPEPKIIEMKA